MAIALSEKQIKDGWQVVKFGEIAREVKSTTKTPLEDGLEFYIGLDHLDPQSLRISRKGIIAEDNPSFTRRFSAGQILFGKRRCYQKKAAVADFEGICSGDIIVIEAIPKKVVAGLLPFIIQSDAFFDWAEKTSSGSLSPRTKWKALAIQKFSLPPIERQHEILEILEKIEENSIKTASAKEATDRLIRSTVTHILDLKSIPMLPLSRLTVSSAFGPRYPSNLYSENGNIGTIRTTDFTSDSRINYTTIPFARLDENKFSNHFLRSGDLLITRSGTIGQVGIFEEQPKPVIAGAFQIRFRLNNKIIPDFARYVLLHPRYQRKMQTLSNGGVQKNITSKSILKIQIPVPSINDQKSITKSITNEQNISDILSNKMEQLRTVSSKIVSKFILGGTQ